ncbi:MAG: hypothetical protein Q7J27_08705 [Syntrophales bacterium]|nr:hypothetical protein [Syntrophales bacterium]
MHIIVFFLRETGIAAVMDFSRQCNALRENIEALEKRPWSSTGKAMLKRFIG